MKSEDVRKIVISKYKKGDSPTKICCDLNNEVCLSTIKRWCKKFADSGSIEPSYSPGRPRTVRTKKIVKKVKTRLNGKKRVSVRILSRELKISKTTAHRILKKDLGCKAYKKTIKPLLTDDHKMKRKQFVNWIRTNFRKEDTMRILFSDEKMFDIDGIYNAQNDRICAVDRVEADKKGGTKQMRKFAQKVMVWLGVCSNGVSPLVIFDKGTVNHEIYIQKVLPVALKYGNQVFGDNWTFQQDGATPHTHNLTQQWCQENFHSFIDKEHWPPNSPDLNPLDYSIWDEFAHVMNWNKIKSKKTLIKELKCAVKKIRSDVVFESCNSWSKRLYRLSLNDFAYLN